MPTSISILPRPERLEVKSGTFQITVNTTIAADVPAESEALFFRDLLITVTGLTLPIETESSVGKGRINFFIKEIPALGAEGYRLSIREEGIYITAFKPAGLFYAAQTLRQLLPAAQHSDWQLPCLEIEDKPRFAWRGFMLDEGRHFHGKQQVLRMLDILAMLKMNVFHWHLTEDQGWRIEIKRYPRLTEIGSQRKGTQMNFFGKRHDDMPYGGFYTQEDIREVVAYAAGRHVTVVPEVEMPGHSLAALAAYPALSCTGGPFEVGTKPGIFLDLYCAGKDATFEFLENVLDELVPLFPAPFFHLGGDEAPKKRWKKCPDCQRRAATQGLDAKHLQVYFTNRMAAFLKERGKRTMGWSEILQEGLTSDAVVQYWLPRPKEITKAIQSGRQVVISAFLDTYLDHSYLLTPLKRAYTYEPLFAGTDERYISGIEAPLWSECVWNSDRLDYQVFPRLLAYAETGWTPRGLKNYPEFEQRLDAFLPLLAPFSVRHAPRADWNPSNWQQIFGTFTILQPQAKTA